MAARWAAPPPGPACPGSDGPWSATASRPERGAAQPGLPLHGDPLRPPVQGGQHTRGEDGLVVERDGGARVPRLGLLEARAEVVLSADEAPAPLPAAFLAKYRERIAALGITPDEFAATYSATIRLTPARALGWHGRSTPRSWWDAVRRLSFGRPALAFGASAA